ncbi:MAG: hypothetical protein KM296_02795 [Brockia lithotrophica]|nr:hypothetical protein [Brockia lithotrophica]
MSLHDGVVELHHSPVCLLYKMDRESFIETLKDAIEKAKSRVPDFPIVFRTATVHGIVRELGFVEVKESDTPLTWFSAFWLTMLNVYNLPRLPVLFVKLFRGRAIEYRLPFDERVDYLQGERSGIYSNLEDEGKEEGKRDGTSRDS